MSMKHLFVPYELALKLRNTKQFEEKCLAYYHDISYELTIGVYKNSDFYKCVAAPLFQQVVDWFREKHGLVIVISPEFDKWDGTIYKDNEMSPMGFLLSINPCNTYYEALTKAIEEVLTHI